MAKKDQLEDKFIELRIEGYTFDEISQELGVSRATLFNWQKENPLQDAISQGRAVRMQSILRKYRINREHQVSRLSKIGDRVLTELESRDLSSVPADKLFTMLNGIQNRLKDTLPPILIDRGPFFDLGDLKKSFDVFD